MSFKGDCLGSAMVLAWVSGVAFAIITLGGLIIWWAGVLGRFLGIQ